MVLFYLIYTIISWILIFWLLRDVLTGRERAWIALVVLVLAGGLVWLMRGVGV